MDILLPICSFLLATMSQACLFSCMKGVVHKVNFTCYIATNKNKVFSMSFRADPKQTRPNLGQNPVTNIGGANISYPRDHSSPNAARKAVFADAKWYLYLFHLEHFPI